MSRRRLCYADGMGLWMALFFSLRALALDSAPPPQKVFGNRTFPDEQKSLASGQTEETTLYRKAMAELGEGHHDKAAGLWQNFTRRYPTHPYYGRALGYLGLALIHAGKASEALDPLRSLIESQPNATLVTEGRILC